jgi:hypothetical protein
LASFRTVMVSPSAMLMTLAWKSAALAKLDGCRGCCQQFNITEGVFEFLVDMACTHGTHLGEGLDQFDQFRGFV